jgi:hypothetical protein
MNDPSIERHIAGPNVIEGDAVEGSFRPFLREMWVRASRGGRRLHFECLTINFDDIHRILDIFSIKAVCQTTSATTSRTQ